MGGITSEKKLAVTKTPLWNEGFTGLWTQLVLKGSRSGDVLCPCYRLRSGGSFNRCRRLKPWCGA